MEIATILLLVACVAAGVAGAVGSTWNLRTKTYSLEHRLTLVEGILQREVKVRAATERWKPSNRSDELLKVTQDLVAQTKPKMWWQDPSLKKGAYVP